MRTFLHVCDSRGFESPGFLANSARLLNTIRKGWTEAVLTLKAQSP